jgi:glycosyltransferase involved in cell wall biosynthesis
LAPLASAIVAVSENTKQDVVKILGVSEEKIHVVYHGCSFPTTGSPSLYAFPYILFVGERGKYKQFSLFVRSVIPVLKKHQDIHVICTGCPFSQQEQESFRDYGVSDRFHHHWVETDHDLYSLYHHAQCFVYPSEYEGFGIPILEAYQAECPVILNHASCFPEIAGDSALYFTSEEELTVQIEQSLGMSSDGRRAFLNQQKQRLSMYSWEKSARQLAAIYQSLC